MRPVLNDPEMNQELLEQGFVHHQLISEEAAAAILVELQQCCPEAMFLPEGDTPTHSIIYSSYLIDDQKLREVGDRLVRQALTESLGALLNDYVILSCGFFIKAPNGGELGLHTHWTVTDSLADHVVNCWCPLVSTNVANGTFHAVPGSHRLFPEIIYFGYAPFFGTYTDEIKEKYSIPLSSKPGQAVIFDDTMMHWSPDNVTDRPRYAAHCTLVPREAQPTYVYNNKENPGEFDVYGVDQAFFVNNGLFQELPPPTDVPLIGAFPDTNYKYTYDEFEDRVARGSEIREHLRSPEGMASLPRVVAVTLQATNETELTAADLPIHTEANNDSAAVTDGPTLPAPSLVTTGDPRVKSGGLMGWLKSKFR